MERKKRKEFTREERQFLHKMLEVGKGYAEIGRMLDRDPRVVKRAAKRYEPESPFTRRALSKSPYDRAKHDYDEHRKRLRKPKNRLRLRTKERQDYIATRLPKASPETIAGRYKRDHPGETMSHEAIYQWIYEERTDLVKHLELVSKRGNRKRTSRKKYRFKEAIKDKVSIEKRPKEVDKRERIGDFERDTVHGKKGSKSCVLNICERSTRLVFLDKLSAINSEQASAVTKKRLKKLPPEMRLTMTQDNGPENAKHAEEGELLGMDNFFCHPHCAPERGTVEVLNRFAIRRSFSKGTNFDTVNFAQIEQAEAAHNNKPMKCLGFRTPLEVFAEELKKYNVKPEDLGLRHLPW